MVWCSTVGASKRNVYLLKKKFEGDPPHLSFETAYLAMSQPFSCEPIVRLIDAHLEGPQKDRHAHSIVAASMPDSGLGDQLSGFIAVLAIAVATGRRMEIQPDRLGEPSYLSVGFTIGFDASFTGEHSWFAKATAWRRSTQFRENTHSLTHRQYKPQHEQWGATFAHSQGILASRMLVPSPSGRYPPTHAQDLTRSSELFIAGNVGARVFRSYFAQQLQRRNITYSPEHMACALRRVLLGASDRVAAAMQRLRPYVPSDNSRLVGVHIRSEAHLISRSSASELARYATGRGDSTVFAGCNPTSDHQRQSTGRSLANFSEFWLASRVAATWLVESGSQKSSPGKRPRLEGWNYSSVKWLLVSDDSELKRQAQASMPERLLATGLVPTHVGVCGAPVGAQGHRQGVEETVAEMLLLAESRVLVFSRSRFPVAALLLSRTCKQAFQLRRDGSCGRTASFAMNPTELLQPWQRHSAWRFPARCLAGSIYTISALQDRRGQLVSNPALEEF